VLAGHCNTERGFLQVLRRRLRSAFAGDLDVRIAAADRDPIVVR
jgi:putative NIF3 family GTP cyclohydrolase 1 type 2